MSTTDQRSAALPGVARPARTPSRLDPPRFDCLCLAGNKTVKSVEDDNRFDKAMFHIDIASEGTRAIVSRTAPNEFFSKLYMFDAATPNPGAEWTVELPNSEILALAISADGSTVAVSAFGLGPNNRVLVFDGASGSNKTEYAWQLPNAATSALLGVSGDGEYVGVLSSLGINNIKVDVIHSTGAHSGPVSNSTLTTSVGQSFGISSDGMYVAAGQATNLIVWKRDSGSKISYSEAFTTTTEGFYVAAGTISFSPDSPHMSVAWQIASNSVSQNKVMVFDLPSSTAIMNVSLPATTGARVNWPIGTGLSSKGQYAVMCCWGAEGQQPAAAQLQVYSTATSSPSPASIFTPGSMMACGIAKQSSTGKVVAIGSGKHTHATVFGNGGDMYVVEVE